MGREKSFSNKKDIEKRRAAFEEFKKQYPDLQDFFDGKEARINKKGDEIKFDAFNIEEGEPVTIRRSINSFNKEKVSVERFESILKNHPLIKKRGDAEETERIGRIKNEKAGLDNEKIKIGDVVSVMVPISKNKRVMEDGWKVVYAADDLVTVKKDGDKTLRRYSAKDIRAWNESKEAEKPQVKKESDEKIEKAEKPEEKEKEKEKVGEEKDSELDELKAWVAEARKNYARKDYDTTNSMRGIKNLIGKYMKTEPRDISDVKESYETYKKALKDLLEYQTTKLKDKKNGTHEAEAEIGEIIRYYNQDEKINLFEARTNARAESLAEHKYGRPIGKGAEYAGRFINWYRKVDWKAKMGVSLLAAMSGAGLVVAGQRIVGGMAAGAGVTAAIESRYRKKEGDRLTKKSEALKEDAIVSKARYTFLMTKLNKEIDTYQDALKTEKEKARKRRLIGATVAVVLGSGAASEVVKWGIDKAGVEHLVDRLKETFGIASGPKGEVYTENSERLDTGKIIDNKSSGGAALSPDEKPQAAPKAEATSEAPKAETAPEPSKAAPEPPKAGTPEAPKTETLPEAPKKVELTVEKGSSFQGAVIKELTEKHNMSAEEAGKKAHLIYRQFLEKNPDPTGHEYHIVQPGAKLELQFDEKGQPLIASFVDSPKAGISETPGPQPDMANKVEDVAQKLKSAVPENLAGNLQDPTLDTLGKSAGIDASGSSAFMFGAGVGAGVAGAKVVEKGFKKIKDNWPTEEQMEQGKKKWEREKAENKLAKAFEKLAKKYELDESDTFNSRAKKFIQAVSMNNLSRWQVLKEMRASSLNVELLSKKTVKNLQSLEKDFVKYFGPSAEIKEDETVKKWMARIIKLSLVKK